MIAKKTKKLNGSEPVEDLEEYPIGEPNKLIKVGSQLSDGQKKKLVSFLGKSSNMFA